MALKRDKYQVIKSNNYVLSHYNMSICAQKVLNLGITKIPRDYDPEKQIEVKMSAREIKRFLNYQGNNVYDMMDEISNELQNIKIVIENNKDGKKVVEKVQPFPYARYDDCELTIRFEKFMNQHLLQLSGSYTQYDINETKEFKSKYTSRMYELCQCIAFKKTQTFELDELKEIIGVRKEIQIETKNKKDDQYIIEDAYPKWNDMRRYALEKAQTEMREKCSLCFEYEPIKKGRSVVAITITVVDNSISKAVEKSKDEQLNMLDIFEMIDECREFLPDEITSSNINTFLLEANYNVDLIRANYEIAKNQKIDNLVAWMITAIREDYASQKKVKVKSSGSSVYNVTELEREILSK